MPIVISNHTKDVQLYINLAPRLSWNYCLTSTCSWIKHQMPNIKYKYSGPFLMRKFCDMHRIPNVFKTQFFSVENIFFSTLWEIVKFEVMEYLIHYVKFDMWTALFYVNYLSYFLQRNFSSIDSKLGFFFQVFPNLQRNFGIFECCSSWTSKFLPIYEIDGKLVFWI